MKKVFCMLLVLLVALLLAAVAFAAEVVTETPAETGLDWGYIVNTVITILVAVFALWVKISNSKVARTLLGLAEAAHEITTSIVSSKDTTEETIAKGTQAKAAALVQEAAKIAPKAAT